MEIFFELNRNIVFYFRTILEIEETKFREATREGERETAPAWGREEGRVADDDLGVPPRGGSDVPGSRERNQRFSGG